MALDTSFLEKCITALENAFQYLSKEDPSSIPYEIYRSACVKEFEIILEQSGKLLKKILKDYEANPREVDRLVFKDIFRMAAKYSLIDIDTTERWLEYRDNRNSTAHDYGEGFANQTLKLIPPFIEDAGEICEIIKNHKSE